MALKDFAAAQENGFVVVIQTEVTPQLKAEGDLREIQSAIQSLRKEMRLPFAEILKLNLRTTDQRVKELLMENLAALEVNTLTKLSVNADSPVEINLDDLIYG